MPRTPESDSTIAMHKDIGFIYKVLEGEIHLLK
jgi:hypothetical protein